MVFQALMLNPVEYLRFISCYGKTNKENYALAEQHMIRHRLLDSQPIGNVFYLHAAIFETSVQRSIIKLPACSGADVQIEIYQLLLLFSIISRWIMRTSISNICFFEISCIVFILITSIISFIVIIHLGKVGSSS